MEMNHPFTYARTLGMSFMKGFHFSLIQSKISLLDNLINSNFPTKYLCDKAETKSIIMSLPKRHKGFPSYTFSNFKCMSLLASFEKPALIPIKSSSWTTIGFPLPYLPALKTKECFRSNALSRHSSSLHTSHDSSKESLSSTTTPTTSI